MREVVDAAALTVALAGGVDDGEIARPGLGEEALLDGVGEGLRMPGADEPATGDGRSVGDARDGLFDGHESGHWAGLRLSLV